MNPFLMLALLQSNDEDGEEGSEGEPGLPPQFGYKFLCSLPSARRSLVFGIVVIAVMKATF
jgi:hypothetical protein